MKALHFVGFRDTDQLWRATQIFGEPHFIHPGFDLRTLADIAPGDDVVFPVGLDCGCNIHDITAHDDWLEKLIERKRGLSAWLRSKGKLPS